MNITFPYQKKVRVLDTATIPMDVLEVIIRHGVMEMAKNPETVGILKAHSHIRKPEKPKATLVSIG